MADWQFETKQIHAGAQPDPTTNARATPIYKTTSYVFNSTEHAKNLFALAEFGNIYTRIMNPTNDVVEQRLAALEGGTAALTRRLRLSRPSPTPFSTSRARATTSSRRRSIYGGTYNLFKYTLAKLGIEVTFVEDQDDEAEWAAAVRPNTKLFFAETIGNPKINILDIEKVAKVAHDNALPLIVDNTIATPYLIRPFEFGADIVVHSATKFLGGHGTVIAGIIVDGGKFPWSKHVDKFPGLTEPDPSYHGASYTTVLGDGIAYVIKARVQLLRDTRRLALPGQRLRAHPGHRDAQPAHRAPRPERAGDRRVAREPPGRRFGQLLGPPVEPVVRGGEQVLAQGRRCGRLVRAQGRSGCRSRARRERLAVQPPRQHR